MKIGSISVEQIFKPLDNGQGQLFDGINVSARISDDGEHWSTASFRYPYSTNNLQGLIEKTLVKHSEGQPLPADVTEFRLEK